MLYKSGHSILINQYIILGTILVELNNSYQAEFKRDDCT